MLKKILKWLLGILLIPVLYLLASSILTFIPVNIQEENSEKNESIYLRSNGIHLDLIIPKDQLSPKILDGIEYSEKDQFFSFGWGDKHFYLNTPTWNDLTLRNAFHALFLKDTTLIHITRHLNLQNDWVAIKMDQQELDQINKYIYETFSLDANDRIVLLSGKAYSIYDDFYLANGDLSCFKTCNSWVNEGLKKSGIKACLWTPFDFGLLYFHKE